MCCRFHQLNLVMKRVFKHLLDEEFCVKLTSVVVHLRRPRNLISSMRSTGLAHSKVRWISISTSSKWLTDHIVTMQQHLNEKKPAYAPGNDWWIRLFAVHALARESTIVFESLQGLTTLLSQQRAKPSGLIDMYCQMTGMVGPLTDADLAEFESMSAEVCGTFAITHNDALSCIDELDIWVLETISHLEEPVAHRLVAAVSKMFVQAANGIDEVIVERDSNNNPSDELLPVLPHQLAKIDLRSFYNIVAEHKALLEKRLSAQQFHHISKDFVEIFRAYRGKPPFQASIGECTDGETDFLKGWRVTGAQFRELRQFCGELKSTFPNTATVESKFSIIRWEKSE